MKKILYGVLGIIMTGAVVTASAYALFSAQATVSGINFSTSSVGLEVSPSGVDGSYTTSLDANLDITNAYPGFGDDNSQNVPLFVRNTSGGIDLDLTAQLTAATGWNDNALKNHVEVAVTLPGDTPGDEDYMTLMEWNDTARALPGTALPAGQTREYSVFVRLPSTAPDTLQNKSLTNITFTITGTQVVSATPTSSPTASPTPTPTSTPTPEPTVEPTASPEPSPAG